MKFGSVKQVLIEESFAFQCRFGISGVSVSRPSAEDDVPARRNAQFLPHRHEGWFEPQTGAFQNMGNIVLSFQFSRNSKIIRRKMGKNVRFESSCFNLLQAGQETVTCPMAE